MRRRATGRGVRAARSARRRGRDPSERVLEEEEGESVEGARKREEEKRMADGREKGVFCVRRNESRGL